MELKKIINSLKEGQREFASDISIIVNTVLLSFVYFVGIGLTSIFAKLTKNHFLDLKENRDGETYWKESNMNEKKMEEFYKQF